MPMLAEDGFTSDRVEVACDVCGRKVVCKWRRNDAPGINNGRPLIELPDDWKVMLTYGTTKQDVICDRCHPYESDLLPWGMGV